MTKNIETVKLVETQPTIWENIKKKSIQLIGGLFMEKNAKGAWTISLGRVSFWLAFIPALVIWISGYGSLDDGISTKDISPNHLTILLTMITYNFGKKVAGTVSEIWGKSDGPG